MSSTTRILACFSRGGGVWAGDVSVDGFSEDDAAEDDASEGGAWEDGCWDGSSNPLKAVLPVEGYYGRRGPAMIP